MESLRFERGVDGPPVEVSVDKEANESVGVRGIGIAREESVDGAGFFREDRAGGGGNWIIEGGAESLLR